MIICGSLLITWGGSVIILGDFTWGGKYTAQGRDGGTIIISMLIGVIAVFWGFFEVKASNT